MDTLKDLLIKAYKALHPYVNGATILICIIIFTLLLAFRKTRKLGAIIFILFMLITAVVYFGALETITSI